MHSITKSGLIAGLALGAASLTCHKQITGPHEPVPSSPTTISVESPETPTATREAQPAKLQPTPGPTPNTNPAPEDPPGGNGILGAETPKGDQEGAGQEAGNSQTLETAPRGGKGRRPRDRNPPRGGDKGTLTAELSKRGAGRGDHNPDNSQTPEKVPEGDQGKQHPDRKPAQGDEKGKKIPEKLPSGQGSDVDTVADRTPEEQTSSRRGSEESSRWYWKDLWLILLGAAVSLYTTVVFERYKRFGELMRTVARTRQHFEGHASSTAVAHLERAHERSIAFYQMLEETEWSLDTDGQHKAAAAVAHLKGFMFQATTCIEHMLAKKTKGLTVDQYLSEYTNIYADVWSQVFLRFEDRIQPEIAPLLRPYPHPVMRRKATAVGVEYFNKLL